MKFSHKHIFEVDVPKKISIHICQLSVFNTSRLQRCMAIDDVHHESLIIPVGIVDIVEYFQNMEWCRRQVFNILLCIKAFIAAVIK